MYMYFAYFGDSVELYKGIPFDCMHMHRERNTPFPIPTPPKIKTKQSYKPTKHNNKTYENKV